MPDSISPKICQRKRYAFKLPTVDVFLVWILRKLISIPLCSTKLEKKAVPYWKIWSPHINLEFNEILTPNMWHLTIQFYLLQNVWLSFIILCNLRAITLQQTDTNHAYVQITNLMEASEYWSLFIEDIFKILLCTAPIIIPSLQG